MGFGRLALKGFYHLVLPFALPGFGRLASSPDIPAMPVVTDPADPIRAILNCYAIDDIGPPGADGQIMALLVEQGLAVRKQIRPMKVGIHRKNRGGMIGASKGMKGLMDKIADLHWNDDERRHALCVKLKSGDREDEKAFREWCEMSGVDLAPVDEGSIASGCESENEELGDGTNYNPAPGAP